jgi:hypothetical protein
MSSSIGEWYGQYYSRKTNETTVWLNTQMTFTLCEGAKGELSGKGAAIYDIRIPSLHHIHSNSIRATK